jgi:hypothetical protein
MAQKSNVVSGAWKSIPENVRGYIVLGGIGVAAYQFYKWYKNSQLQDEIDKKAAEIKAYNKAGVVASFPDGQYVAWGKMINDELNSVLNIDEDKIFSVFRQLKNIVDVYKLQSAITYTEGLVWKQTDTLDQALSFYLSDSDIDVINKILASKNIAYQFSY